MSDDGYDEMMSVADRIGYEAAYEELCRYLNTDQRRECYREFARNFDFEEPEDDVWSHFDYTSGANPYIAKTERERERVLAKYDGLGIKVEERPSATGGTVRFYVVHDLKVVE